MDIEKDIREAVIKYSDMLYKICIVILCNEQDVQDAIQDTFCRYWEKGTGGLYWIPNLRYIWYSLNILNVWGG